MADAGERECARTRTRQVVHETQVHKNTRWPLQEQKNVFDEQKRHELNHHPVGRTAAVCLSEVAREIEAEDEQRRIRHHRDACNP